MYCMYFNCKNTAHNCERGEKTKIINVSVKKPMNDL